MTYRKYALIAGTVVLVLSIMLHLFAPDVDGTLDSVILLVAGGLFGASIPDTKS